MSVAKSLSEEQIAQIQGWADEGAGLPEIQRRLNSDLGIKVTYMELRFLMDDIGVVLKPVEVLKEEEEPEEPETPESVEGETADDEAAPGGEGKVTVTISELVRPGAMVSGRVIFANGQGANWWMDQMGRLGMDADDPSQRPTEEDLKGFQQELQRVAREKGM